MAGRYRVVITGFDVLNATWDDAGEWDGKGDEVFISCGIRKVDAAGNDLYPTALKKVSATMGDVNSQPGRVQAGSKWGGKGGLQTGDKVPHDQPWLVERDLEVPFPSAGLNFPPIHLHWGPSPERQYPPWVVWEGELSDTEAVFISPSICEFDPAANFLEGWFRWIEGTKQTLGTDEAKALLNGPLASAAPVITGIQIGAGLISGLFDLDGPFGHAGTRPIGLTRNDQNPRKFDYIPQILALTAARADELIADEPIAQGPGCISLEFRDDPILWGHYVMYVVVEKVAANAPVVAPAVVDPQRIHIPPIVPFPGQIDRTTRVRQPVGPT